MSDAIRLIRSSELSEAPYAYAATVAPGARLIFLAGACPLDVDGAVVAIADYAGQTQRALENLVKALAAAGAVLTDVVSTRVLVASSDRADLSTVWGIVQAFFADHDVPSTLLGVTVLGYPDQLVEIEATAAVFAS